jgi:hypothetical protein
MVTRNRRFPNPGGYSRRSEKRAAVRLVAEELEAGPYPRLQRRSGAADVQTNSHLALELGPRVPVRTGLDLRAVDRGGRRRATGVTATQTRAAPPVLLLLRRLWQQFCRWASWR